MSHLNKTNIEWCTRTFNPVTGCLHGCPYCYARKIAKRFETTLCPDCGGSGWSTVYEVNGEYPEPSCLRCKGRGLISDPDAFQPKFHPERLDAPAREKKPQRIFVGSMCDLFGEWVPDEWIEQVFKACEAAPWHTYYFLTKNPKRYSALPIRYLKQWWMGFSANTDVQYRDGLYVMTYPSGKVFVSLEPLFTNIDIRHWCFYIPRLPNWLIVGAQSNPTVMPKREWIESIREQCRDLKIPLFEKNSLKPLMGDLIQEVPE